MTFGNIYNNFHAFREPFPRLNTHLQQETSACFRYYFISVFYPQIRGEHHRKICQDLESGVEHCVASLHCVFGEDT